MGNVDYGLMKKLEAQKNNILKLNMTQRLHCAAYAIAIKNIGALRDLLKEIPHVDCPINGQTLLKVSASVGFVVAAKMLIEEFNADPNDTDLYGITALDVAIECNQTEIIEYLNGKTHALEVADVVPLHVAPRMRFS